MAVPTGSDSRCGAPAWAHGDAILGGELLEHSLGAKPRARAVAPEAPPCAAAPRRSRSVPGRLVAAAATGCVGDAAPRASPHRHAAGFGGKVRDGLVGPRLTDTAFVGPVPGLVTPFARLTRKGDRAAGRSEYPTEAVEGSAAVVGAAVHHDGCACRARRRARWAVPAPDTTAGHAVDGGRANRQPASRVSAASAGTPRLAESQRRLGLRTGE